MIQPDLKCMWRYTTLWNVSVLKATTENWISATTRLEKLLLSQLVSKVTVISCSQFLRKVFNVSFIIYSNCRILQFSHQMFNVSALLLDDALL